MRKFLLITLLLSSLFTGYSVYASATDSAKKEPTCPQIPPWTKIDSDDLSTYPVRDAIKYCFKAGSSKSQGCNGGLFDEWPQPPGTCGLSHWSYQVDPSPTPSPSVDPSPSATPSASPSPSISPSPSPTVVPSPSPKGTPNVPKSEPKEEKSVEEQMEDLREELIEEYGEVPPLGFK